MRDSDSFRLLLVEDNPGDAHIAQQQLSDVPDCAFDVICAPRLQEAVRLLRADSIDGVILDLNLPDSRGIDTLRRLREVDSEVAVVVMSGSDDSALRHLAFTEGAHGFIGKSEPATNLMARSVLYALERHRGQSLHRQIEHLVAANPDAVIVVDSTNVVRFMNQAAERFFAVSRERMIGDHLEFAFREGEAQEIELARNGKVRTAEVRVAEIEWDGAPSLLATVRDVTEQRRLAEQLRQSQKMEAVGLLAGGIAHDFNNLLVVMMSCADLLAEALDGTARHGVAPSGQLQEVVEELQQSTERARALTTQLLVFTGQRPSRPQVIDLQQVVQGIYKLLRRMLPESIEISNLPCEGVWPVRIDPAQLGQVVLNLAVNARDAMPSGGHLWFEFSNLTREGSDGSLPSGDYAVLRVVDDGCGISAEYLTRVFEPFFTTKEPGKGTGLGLAICRAIVHQAEGEILIESLVSQGTTVSLLLPRSAGAARPSDDGAMEAEAARGKETILVVEDDPAVARMTALILRNHGYHVLTAANGDEARRLLDEPTAPVDLVLSDMVMPQMGGQELAEHIERTRPGLRLLLMSGYAEEVLASTGVAGSTHPVLHKPFLPHELLARVRRILDRDLYHPYPEPPIPGE